MQVRLFDKYDKGGAYHWKWYLTNFDGYQSFTNAIVNLIPGEGSLLDMGCGDGLISYLFFRSGFKVSGIDTSETGIHLAKTVSQMALKKRMGEDINSVQGMPFTAGNHLDLMGRFEQGGLSFTQMSAFDIKGAKKFDYLLCAEVIEHVQNPEKLLDIIHRITREFAIITTPDGLLPDGKIGPPGPYDFHVWSKDSFADLLRSYQFEFLNMRPGTIGVKLFC